MEDFMQLRHLDSLNNLASKKIAIFDPSPDRKHVNYQNEIIEYPSICSFCNKTGEQKLVDISGISGEHNFDAVGVFYCNLCKNSTINYFKNEKVYYTDEKNSKTEYLSVLVVSDQSPRLILENEIPETIQTNYPTFFDIYNQSIVAEKNDLLHLSGMGYRKSIEFLVTDFLKDYPTDDTVTKEWLENPKITLKMKIQKLPNQRLINTGTAIAYLGNDETHYTSRHPEFDLQHMKKFIGLLIKELESELIYHSVKNFLE